MLESGRGETLSERQLRMGEFTIDLGAQSLRRGDRPIHLKPQVFAVLAYLVENAGVLVTRDALIEHIWGRCEVDFDANLNTIMLQIRRALSDAADAPRYIETVPRKGYRIVSTVTELAQAPYIRPRLLARRALAAMIALVFLVTAIGPAVPDSIPDAQISPETQVLYARGKEALQAGNFGRAIELLEQALNASPEFAAGHACLALAHIGVGKGGEAGLRRAKRALQRAAAIDPHDVMLLTVSAQIALTVDAELDRARLLLDQALAREDGDSHIHLLSAWQYSATGDHDKARHAIQRALLLDPLSPRINLSAARIYEAAGELEDARRFNDLARELTAET